MKKSILIVSIVTAILILGAAYSLSNTPAPEAKPVVKVISYDSLHPQN